MKKAQQPEEAPQAEATANAEDPRGGVLSERPLARERENSGGVEDAEASPADEAAEQPAPATEQQPAPEAPSYIDRIIARAKELRDSDAFAPAEPRDPEHVSAAEALAASKASARQSRVWIVVFAVICAAVALFSLLLPYYGIDNMGAQGTIYAPADVFDCYVLWFRMNVLPLFDPTLANQTSAMYAEFAQSHPDGMYSLVMNRALVTVIVMGCGIMLAVSGLLFQTAFRNPLATPSMLGVSDGVTLGCIIYCMMGNASIGDNPTLYLVLVYGLGAAAVVVVLFLSRGLTGGERYNVLDMLLLGTVICQLLSGINNLIQNFIMDETAWFNFYDVQQAGNALLEPVIVGVVVVVFAITFVVALLYRFKFNLISFSDEEGTMMGVHAGALRAGALVLGSAMQLAAIASIGQVAMLSLAVPFLVRYMMPADFRSQFLGNCLVGMAMLLVCMALQQFATVGIVTMPVGTIVSIVIIPFFVWMMALGRGRW